MAAGDHVPRAAEDFTRLHRWLRQLDDLAADALQDDWTVPQLESELERLRRRIAAVLRTGLRLPRSVTTSLAIDSAADVTSVITGDALGIWQTAAWDRRCGGASPAPNRVGWWSRAGCRRARQSRCCSAAGRPARAAASATPAAQQDPVDPSMNNDTPDDDRTVAQPPFRTPAPRPRSCLSARDGFRQRPAAGHLPRRVRAAQRGRRGRLLDRLPRLGPFAQAPGRGEGVLPVGHGRRSGGTQVVVRSERHTDAFEAGLKASSKKRGCWRSSTTRR
jgi:hypothetical protein